MSLSFPYPKNGSTTRPIGQGCKSCVFMQICPAVYWFRRYTFKDLDEANGRACTSWSTNPADKVKIPTEDDLNEEDYMYVQGLGSEAVRNGFGETTGGSRQSEGT